MKSILISLLFASSTLAYVPPSMMAGFGAKKATKAPKLKTLKPKQQWDRYGDFAKKSTKHEVGVKVLKDGDATNDWLSVGYVNAKNDAFDVELVVARQRSLIADHAKRLHPLSVMAKDKLEWGYCNSDGEWVGVAAVNDFVKNFEKEIGFEGIGDPNSGYYCHYKDGKVIALNTGESQSTADSED